MTICFSQLPLETQRDIAETLVYCFPTMNERQRVYQIANIYIPFHSIADPVEIWMYVFQIIQKNPKKTHALLEASHFILKNRLEEALASTESSQDKSVVDFETDASNDTQLKKDIHDQTLEALSLLEEICIILEAQNIVNNTSNGNFVAHMPSRFTDKFTKDIFSTKNPKQRNSNSRLSGQFALGMAAVMLLSVGFSFSLSSNADQSTVNGQQASVNAKKTQLANINVETRIKKLPLNSRQSKNDKLQNNKSQHETLQNDDHSDYISISSQHLGTHQYKSKSGIIIENVKNETLSSVPEQSTDDTILQNNTRHSNINNSLISGISHGSTEESSSFVPSVEKESQVFKDPLAAAISKATDRLIEQHQKTTQNQTATTNTSTLNKKKVSTVVPLLQGSDVHADSKMAVSDVQLKSKSGSNQTTTSTKSKSWSKCSSSSKGTLYGYWWAGKISSEEEKFTSGQIVYIGNWSNVRKGPSSKTDRVCVLQPGQQIKLKEDAKTYGNSQWVAIYSDSIQ